MDRCHDATEQLGAPVSYLRGGAVTESRDGSEVELRHVDERLELHMRHLSKLLWDHHVALSVALQDGDVPDASSLQERRGERKKKITLSVQGCTGVLPSYIRIIKFLPFVFSSFFNAIRCQRTKTHLVMKDLTHRRQRSEMATMKKNQTKNQPRGTSCEVVASN